MDTSLFFSIGVGVFVGFSVAFLKKIDGVILALQNSKIQVVKVPYAIMTDKPFPSEDYPEYIQPGTYYPTEDDIVEASQEQFLNREHELSNPYHGWEVFDES
jgi:hypothetical protein